MHLYIVLIVTDDRWARLGLIELGNAEVGACLLHSRFHPS